MPNDNANKIKDLLNSTTPAVDYERLKKAKDLDPAKASAMHAAGKMPSSSVKTLEKIAGLKYIPRGRAKSPP